MDTVETPASSVKGWSVRMVDVRENEITLSACVTLDTLEKDVRSTVVVNTALHYLESLKCKVMQSI